MPLTNLLEELDVNPEQVVDSSRLLNSADEAAADDIGTTPPDGSPPESEPIEDWHDLDSVRDDLSDDYVLMNDLTPETDGYDEVVNPEGSGFAPIDSFTGTLDGLDNEIEGLVIDRDEPNVGLFGTTSGAIIKNIGLVDVDINAETPVGGIIGDASNETTIENSFVTGSISGDGVSTGGRDPGTGGLVGRLGSRDDETGQITQSYADIDIIIVESLSDDDGFDGGGLVGRNFGEITESFATGSVTGEGRVGGLVGNNDGEITKSYANAAVDGDLNIIGGLSGSDDGEITESFATGSVTNGSFDGVGGIAGSGDSDIQDSYWDRGTTTQLDAVGSGDPGDGVEGFGDVNDTNPADEMTGDDAPENMVALSFDDTWQTITEGDSLPPAPTEDGYPILQAIDAEPQLEAQNLLSE